MKFKEAPRITGTTSLWIRFCLLFVARQYVIDGEWITVYKHFRGTYYIVDSFPIEVFGDYYAEKER